jgi:coenzyme PQQ precursor peptide PqqA
MASIGFPVLSPRLDFSLDRIGSGLQKEEDMAWNKPKIAVVCVGMEINSYVSARR